MARYHINPETGRVNICRASDSSVKGCPFGGAADHYSSKEEARTAYEKKNNTFESAPLKKLSSKEKEEIARQERIDKWGPEGKGPNVDGLSSDEAFEARKRYAKSTIQNFGLTSDSSDEEIAEAAHRVGLPASFLKNRIGAEVFYASRAQLREAWNKKYGKSAPKPKPVPVEGTDFEIDSQWTRIPGEGHFKFIKNTSGKETASLQIRDGFYILGARDEVGGFVQFQENSFISEKDALEYLKRNQKLLKI